MSKIPCTKKAVDDLPFDGDNQTLHWFEGLTGFGVLLSGKKKVKTLIVQRNVKGKGVIRRISLCTREQMEAQRPPMTMEEAKSRASKLLVDMQNGIDPLEEKRDAAKAKADLEAKNKIESVTLGQAFDLYLKSHVNLRKRSQDSYTYNLEKRFKDWMDTPLNTITPKDLVDRYKSIKIKVEEGKHRKKYTSDVYVNKPGIAAANGALRVIRAVWSFAAIRFPGVPPWPKGFFSEATTYKIKPRKRHLKPEENGDLARFYNAVNKTNEAGEYIIGRIARDAIILLLFTGMRFREMAELTD